MKKLLVITIILTSLLGCINLNAQLLKDAKKFVDKKTGGLSEKDAADGIREALVKGTGESVKLVANVDGYFGNPEIKIPFPPEAKEIESKLRSMGMGKKVDEVVLSLNRAAEDAGNEAKPIFIYAFNGMIINYEINFFKG
jgi:hypothetical protein